MRASRGEKVFYVINDCVLIIFSILCILPFINIVANSFSNNAAVSSGQVFLLPKGFNMQSYQLFFKNARAFTAIKNSIVITVVSVVSQVIFTTLCAYPLSRKYFIGKKHVTMGIVFTMLFSGGVIPMYLLLKALGFINSFNAVWFPSLVNTFNMLMMKTFFEGLPDELMEAAEIDGCGEFGKLISVAVPLSGAIFATITLFSAVGAWNAFSGVLMYIPDSTKHNLPVMINQMTNNLRFMQEITAEERATVNQSITPDSVRAAGVVILTMPMLSIYPFLQKYFVKGVMIGAIKG